MFSPASYPSWNGSGAHEEAKVAKSIPSLSRLPEMSFMSTLKNTVSEMSIVDGDQLTVYHSRPRAQDYPSEA